MNATNLSLAEAQILDQNGTSIAALAQMTIRGTLATVRQGDTVNTTPGVVAVLAQNPGVWRITFEDGSAWTVTRMAGAAGVAGCRKCGH